MRFVHLVVPPKGAPSWAASLAERLLAEGYSVTWLTLGIELRPSIARLVDTWMSGSVVDVVAPQGVEQRNIVRSALPNGRVVWAHPDAPPPDADVLRVRLGGQPWPSPLLGLRQTARPSGTVELCVTRQRQGGLVSFARAKVRADQRSPARTLRSCSSKVPSLVLTALQGESIGTVVARQRPHTPEVVVHSARVFGRWIADRLALRGFVDQWQVGFRFGGDPFDLATMHWPEPPLDRFWADPFPLEHDGRTFVFFEELLYADWKGRICVAEVHPDGRFEVLGVALELPTHLSFPQVFEADGELWMVPESIATQEIALYRCVTFPLGWEKAHVLAEGPFVDTAVFRWNAGWAMLTSRTDGPAESANDNLYAATAPTLTGPWTGLDAPVVIDATGARLAGAPAHVGGRWYRVGQDCSVRYGYGMRLHELVDIGPNRLEETVVASWPPASQERARHTWGVAGDLVVMDRQVRRKR